MNKIEIVLDYELFKLDMEVYLQWEYEKYPHMLLVGSTGTGKTYLTKLILARIGLKVLDADVMLCDFKGDEDFNFLAEQTKFYRYMECLEGLNLFYDEFTNRQSGADKTRNFKLLVFDEWSSFCNMLDKKQAEEVKKKLSNILMLGRSFNVHVLISQQRPDAEYFAKSRDNFSMICALGNLSNEGKQMLFSDFKDRIEANCKQGEGYILIGGYEITKIIVPKVRNIKKLNTYIKKAVEI